MKTTTSPTLGRLRTMLLGAASILLVVACNSNQTQGEQQETANTPETVASAASSSPEMEPATAKTPKVHEAVAVLHATEGNSVAGVVRFTEAADGIVVHARVEGLEPNSTHGFHIHEYGDCVAPDATSAGSHYDPFETGHHGRPGDERKHGGDLGNLVANADGVATYDATVSDVTFGDGVGELLGLAVIVHAEADHFDQPTGSAGARLACGVIGSAQPTSGEKTSM